MPDTRLMAAARFSATLLEQYPAAEKELLDALTAEEQRQEVVDGVVVAATLFDFAVPFEIKPEKDQAHIEVSRQEFRAALARLEEAGR